MAYVDAEKLKRNIRINFMPNVDVDGTVTVENAERYFLNLIDKTSIADVAEVVRCKDCKKWTTVHTCKEFTASRSPMSGKITFMTEADDFCSYGERKE